MKSAVLILCLLFFESGYSALTRVAEKKPLPVKVLDATVQDWISGAPGGRSGTGYAIKLHILTDRKVEFKNVWLGKENIVFNVEYFTADGNKKTSSGDSLLLTWTNFNANPNVPVIKNENPKRLPLEYKGAALIECTVNGNARYFVVKNFKRLDTVRGQ